MMENGYRGGVMVQVRNTGTTTQTWQGYTWQPGQDIDIPAELVRSNYQKDNMPNALKIIPSFGGGGGGRTLGINTREVLDSL